VKRRNTCAFFCIFVAVGFILFWLAISGSAHAEPVQISIEHTPATGPVHGYGYAARACDVQGNVGPQSEWSECFALPEIPTALGFWTGAALLGLIKWGGT
jgi:hypothetical protein